MREKLCEADRRLMERIGETDQEHIKRAYKKCKAVRRELLECKHLETPVIHAMRKLYEVEDILWQYATE